MKVPAEAAPSGGTKEAIASLTALWCHTCTADLGRADGQTRQWNLFRHLPIMTVQLVCSAAVALERIVDYAAHHMCTVAETAIDLSNVACDSMLHAIAHCGAREQGPGRLCNRRGRGHGCRFLKSQADADVVDLVPLMVCGAAGAVFDVLGGDVSTA